MATISESAIAIHFYLKYCANWMAVAINSLLPSTFSRKIKKIMSKCGWQLVKNRVCHHKKRKFVEKVEGSSLK